MGFFSNVVSGISSTITSASSAVSGFMANSAIGQAAGSVLSSIGLGGIINTIGAIAGVGSAFVSEADSAYQQMINAATSKLNGYIQNDNGSTSKTTHIKSSILATDDANAITGDTYSTKDYVSAFQSFKIKVSSWMDSKNTNNLYQSIQDLPNIFGLPLTFTTNTDPRGRAYTKHILNDAPIITMIPGLPQFNGGLSGMLKRLMLKTGGALGVLTGLTYAMFGNSWNDMRYYSFKTDYAEYYSYVNTMLQLIQIRMGLNSKTVGTNKQTNEIYEFAESAGMVNNISRPMSISYYLSNFSGSIVSEMFSNTFSESPASSTANSYSDSVRELNYLTGKTSGNINIANVLLGAKRISGISKLYNNMFNPNDVANSVLTADTTLMGQIRQAENGMKLIFPQMWNGSDYGKSVNVTVKFFSPYGDPKSIFKYVYVPFCSLLGFALPRQASEMGYLSPVICRADVPGLFTSDMAAITSFSFQKGGSEDLWTSDGYPRCIECQFTLQDLYPVLMMGKRINILNLNPGFLTFLDNMCGISATYNKVSLDAISALNMVNAGIAEADDWSMNIVSDATSNMMGSGAVNQANKIKATYSAMAKNISLAIDQAKQGG